MKSVEYKIQTESNEGVWSTVASFKDCFLLDVLENLKSLKAKKPSQKFRAVKTITSESLVNDKTSYEELRTSFEKIVMIADNEDLSSRDAIGQVEEIAIAALGVRPRNCDVGTVTEQIGRFENFCDSYKQNCEGCPLANDDSKTLMGCAIKWGQMPYNE